MKNPRNHKQIPRKIDNVVPAFPTLPGRLRAFPAGLGWLDGGAVARAGAREGRMPSKSADVCLVVWKESYPGRNLGKPRVLPWFCHGFAMVLPWFYLVQRKSHGHGFPAFFLKFLISGGAGEGRKRAKGRDDAFEVFMIDVVGLFKQSIIIYHNHVPRSSSSFHCIFFDEIESKRSQKVKYVCHPCSVVQASEDAQAMESCDADPKLLRMIRVGSPIHCGRGESSGLKRKGMVKQSHLEVGPVCILSELKREQHGTTILG